MTTDLFGLLQGFDTSIYSGDTMWPPGRFAGPATPLAKSAEDKSCFSGGHICLQFGSDHPGICHFAMGNGSVHAVSVSINTQVLGYMAICNDGQVIPPS